MLYLTQLIYIHEGQEATFLEFEAIAIPIIYKYNGQLDLRIRPTKETWIAGEYEMPYEVHLASFANEEDFNNFMLDEERKKHVHLKERAIKKVILLKGRLA
jgi:hypothetical protein